MSNIATHALTAAAWLVPYLDSNLPDACGFNVGPNPDRGFALRARIQLRSNTPDGELYDLAEWADALQATVTLSPAYGYHFAYIRPDRPHPPVELCNHLDPTAWRELERHHGRITIDTAFTAADLRTAARRLASSGGGLA